jgi:hypothetical protein
MRSVVSWLQEVEQEEHRKVVTGVLRAGLESPQSEKEWQKGPHSEALALIESFARGQTGAPHGTALFSLLDLGLPATPDGAAQLLKKVGYWPAHLPNALVCHLIPFGPRFLPSFGLHPYPATTFMCCQYPQHIRAGGSLASQHWMYPVCCATHPIPK